MKFNLSIFGGIIIILTLIVSACGPSQQELAAKKMKVSEELLAKGDTLNSLLYLDSIPKLYPEAGSELNKAIQAGNRIYTFQLSKQREKLSAANTVIGTLIKDFKSEKGEFEKYTNYIPNRQVFDKSWSRSFVQVNVNDKGDLTLSSNYYGEKWINHTSLRIDRDGLIIRTDSVPLDHINNHHSDFGGSNWEKVTYRGKQADAVIAMIATNWDRRLKALFKGKTTYIMWLEDYDKKGIKEAYELSKAFRAKSEAEKMIPVLEKKIKT